MSGTQLLRAGVNVLHRHAFVATRSAAALVLGLVSVRHRGHVARMAAELGFQEGPRPLLPTASAESVTRNTTPVELHALESHNGNVSLLELLLLARLARERAPAAIFEIGTFDGRTTLNLALHAPAETVVYTLDLPPDVPTVHALAPAERAFVEKPRSGARFVDTPASAKVRQLYGDSATFDFSPYRAQLVFIDGSHVYAYARSDSLHALDLLGDGPGLIVWHDYGAWEGVTRALHDLHREDARFRGLTWIRDTTLVLLEVSAAR